MKRKAAILVNGDLADLSRVRAHIDKNTLLIGCDGGAAHILALGLTPHVVIGDFDSISSKVLRVLKQKNVELIRYPRDKLYTDTELGVALAMERGCRDIVLAGVRGTHTDHLIGNLSTLAKKKFAALSFKVIDGNEEITLVRKHIRIKGKNKDIVSLLPAGRGARGVTTKGLYYPLRNATIPSGSTRGLRNHMTGKHAEITVREGTLLVIHHLA